MSRPKDGPGAKYGPRLEAIIGPKLEANDAPKLKPNNVIHPIGIAGQMIRTVQNAEVIRAHAGAPGEPIARSAAEFARGNVVDLQNVGKLGIEADSRRDAEPARERDNQLRAARGGPRVRGANGFPDSAGAQREGPVAWQVNGRRRADEQHVHGRRKTVASVGQA